MSSTIDERVVEMRFDNKQFESNAKTSINTIERLKEALNFSDSGKSFNDLQSAANRVNFNSLGSAIESVKLRFSALEIAAITAFQNIVNRAVNAGIQIAKSFTLGPIISGFNEYEQKIGSIQTILANTQNQQGQVTQDALGSMNQVSSEAVAAQNKLAQQQTKNLQAAHSAQTKALQKSAQQQLKAYSKQTEAMMEALQEKQEKQQEKLEKKQEKQIEKFNAKQEKQNKQFQSKYTKRFEAAQTSAAQEVALLESTQEEETEILEKTIKQEQKMLKSQYDESYKALQQSQKRELKELEKAHEAKLEQYEEEYMAKLKATDEQRYQKIKQIDDQINALNALTEAENEEQEQAAQNQKIAQLEKEIDDAVTYKQREIAEQNLADYIRELQIKETQKQREEQIKQLEAKKDDIDEEFDLIEANLKEEYNERKENEKDIYDETKDSIKERQDLEKDAAKELYDAQLEALKEQQDARKEMLDQQHEAEMQALEEKNQKVYEAIQKQYEKESEALEKKQKKEQKNFDERIQNEKKALQDRQKDETEALQDRREAGQEALQERQEVAREALAARQSAEMDALQAQHEQAMSNIQTETSARLGASKAIAKGEVKETTLDDVNKALGELNEYADKTIYNFGDMTDAIGKFTAAGVDLDTSVDAIKGISNLAAMSGTSSSKASEAMYQLSQAIAAGTVRYQDWMSVQHADMGGAAFQNALKETARVHGIQVDEMIAKNGSFQNSLHEGWLSSEIMLETLQKFTGDLSKEELRSMGYTEDQIDDIIELGQTAVDAATKVRTFSQVIDTTKEAMGSGWAETFELIFGNFDEATELWTGVSEIVGEVVDKQADARNKLLKSWKEGGGRDAIIQGFRNLWDIVTHDLKPITEAFHNIFPPVAADQLINFSKKFELLTTKMLVSAPTLKNLKSTFEGIFTVIKWVGQAIGSVAKGFTPLLGVAKDLAGGFLELTGQVGEWIVNIDGAVQQSGIFATVTDTISTALETAYGWLKNFFGEIIKIPDFSSLESLKDVLLGAVQQFANWVLGIDTANTKSLIFFKTAGGLKGAIERSIAPIATIFTNVKEAIKGAFDRLQDFVQALKNFVSSKFKMPNVVKAMGADEDGGETKKNKNPFSWIINAVKDTVTGIKNAVKGGADKVTGFFTSIGDAVTKAYDVIKSIGAKLKEAVQKVKDTLSSFIQDAGKIFNFENLSKAMGLAQKGASTSLVFSIASFIRNITASIKNLTEAFKKVGTIGDALKSVLDPVKTPIIEMCDAIKTSVTGTFKSIQKEIDSKALMNVAKAILVLVAALGVMSLIPEDKLKSSSIVIAGLFAGLTISLKQISKSLSSDKSSSISGVSSAMISMGASVLLLAFALKKIGSLDMTQMGAAMVAVIVLIEDMVRVAKNLSNNSYDQKRVTKGMKSLIALAASVWILASAVKKLGAMDVDELLIGVFATVALIQAVSNMVKEANGKGLKTSTGIGIIALAASMLIFQEAVEEFGKMDIKQLIQGGVAVLALVGALTVFNKVAGEMKKGGFGSAVGTVAIAASIRMLVGPIKELGTIPFEQLAQGLLGVGTVLVEFAFALTYMEGKEKASLGILAVSAALLVLTPVLLTLSLMGLDGLVVSLAGLAGVFAVIGVAATVLEPVVPTFLELAKGIALIGLAAAGIGAGLLLFSAGMTALSLAGPVAAYAFMEVVKVVILQVLQIIKDAIPLVIDIIKIFIIEVMDALVELVPQVIQDIVDIIVYGIGALASFIPEIIDVVMDFLIKCIEAIREHIPELVQQVVALVVEFFASITEELKSMPTETLQDALLGAGILALFLKAMAALSLIAGPAMIGILECAAIVAELGLLLTAIGALAQIPGLKFLIGEGGELLQSIGEAIGKFIGGIVGGILIGSTDSLPDVADNLTEFAEKLEGFLTGIDDIDQDKLNAVNNLITIVQQMQDAEDYIKDGSFGETLTSFSDEMIEFGPKLVAFSNSVKGVDAGAVRSAKVAAGIMSELANGLPAHGGFIQDLLGDQSLTTFASELDAFGPAIKGFSDTVAEGIDETAVTSAANAASIMANMASTLQGHNGFMQALLGDKSLSNFAAELEAFGPKIVGFSNTVKDNIDETAVESAANAGQLLAGLANNIPDSGLWQTLFGGKDLSVFGADLESFGTHLKNYSDKLTADGGIKFGTVNNATRAAEAVAALANNLPESPGPIASFFGAQSDLEKFGEDLVSFGGAMGSYGASIADIDSDAVEASANAAGMLVELEDSIGDQGSFADTLFGTTDFEQFGKSLKGFGGSLSTYYDSIDGISAQRLENTTAQIQNLLDVATNAASLDTSGFNSFSSAIAAMGQSGLTAFVDEFQNCSDTIDSAINAMVGFVSTAIEKYTKDLKTAAEKAGKNTTTYFMDGMSSLYSKDLNDTVSKLSTTVSTKLTAVIVSKTYKPYGVDLVQYIIDGMGSMEQTAAKKANSVADQISKSMSNKLAISTFNGYGSRIVSAVKKGMESQLTTVTTSAKSVANSVKNEFKDILTVATFRTYGEHISGLDKGMSSQERSLLLTAKGIADDIVEKVKGIASYNQFYSIGTYITGGLIDGMDRDRDKLRTEAANLGNDATVTVKETLDEHSPSKVMAEIGENFDLGFIEGIKGKNGAVEKAAKKLADQILKKAQMISDLEDMNPADAASKAAMKSEEERLKEELRGMIRDFNVIKADYEATTKDMLWSTTKTLNGNDAQNAKQTAFEFGSDISGGIANGLIENVEEIDESSMSLAALSTVPFGEDPSGITAQYGDQLGYGLTSSLASNEPYVKTSTNAIAQDIITALDGAIQTDTFIKIGNRIGEGLAEGINAKKGIVDAAAKGIAQTAQSAIEINLDIHSPSRVTARLGEYFGMGFSNGILSQVRSVANASGDMAETAVDPIQIAMDHIIDTIENSDNDYTPTITPVLDLSNVSQGADQVSSMFQGLDLSTSMGLAQSANAGFSSRRAVSADSLEENNRVNRKLDKLIEGIGDGPKTENHNVFYIQSTDPKQAANEVGYILQRQVERRRAAWGR